MRRRHDPASFCRRMLKWHPRRRVGAPGARLRDTQQGRRPRTALIASAEQPGPSSQPPSWRGGRSPLRLWLHRSPRSRLAGQASSSHAHSREGILFSARQRCWSCSQYTRGWRQKRASQLVRGRDPPCRPSRSPCAVRRARRRAYRPLRGLHFSLGASGFVYSTLLHYGKENMPHLASQALESLENQ